MALFKAIPLRQGRHLHPIKYLSLQLKTSLFYTDFENKKLSINKFTPNVNVNFHLNFIENNWKIDTLFHNQKLLAYL